MEVIDGSQTRQCTATCGDKLVMDFGLCSCTLLAEFSQICRCVVLYNLSSVFVPDLTPLPSRAVPQGAGRQQAQPRRESVPFHNIL